MPKLYVMIGLSASGKSTIANKIKEDSNIEIVSSDKIREEYFGGVENQSNHSDVFQIFYQKIVSILNSGHDVIADATNITIKSRKQMFQHVKDIECDIIGYLCVKDINSCIIDDKKRENSVGKRAIERQRDRFQLPFKEEGFKDILIFNNVDMEKYKPDDYLKMMEGFEQENPHHTQTLLEHVMSVANRLTVTASKFDSSLLVAGLYHDIGKLYTKTKGEDGVAHYYSHENYGAYLLLTNLCYKSEENIIVFSNIEKEYDTIFYVNYHMLPNQWVTTRTINKWSSIFGEEKFEKLKLINEADKWRKEQ